ncbi:HK97 gp10 family phage protein [Pseudaminobacter sp. NGMCC 1.201702]|uniref:HK97 gp10 family phage protein n=1 Tax=Pseudaminobacter sp. NGMCC 1.201702 TaxID=3391825 RepID=UPI0039EEA272
MAKSIIGLDRLNRKLKKLPAAAERAIREAMAAGADEIVAMMASLVSVDSGDLRGSIGWAFGEAPKGALKLATVKAANGKTVITIYAGNSEAFYARWVEFGTAAHTAGGMFNGSTIPAIPASPFFYVSFRSLRRRTKSRITRAITQSAKQVAAGGGSSS